MPPESETDATSPQPGPSLASISQPQAPFLPVFALVNNSSTNTTHHPKVRYIFADDDPDALTQALAEQHTHNESKDPSRDRALVLDLEPSTDGNWHVAAASSLSADFAVVDAKISRMEDSEKEGDGGLMLKIEGVENELPSAAGTAEADLPSSGSGAQIGASQGREEYGTILDEFDKKMGIMRRVVASGEERMRKIQERQAQGTQEPGDNQVATEEKGKEKESEE